MSAQISSKVSLDCSSFWLFAVKSSNNVLGAGFAIFADGIAGFEIRSGVLAKVGTGAVWVRLGGSFSLGIGAAATGGSLGIMSGAAGSTVSIPSSCRQERCSRISAASEISSAESWGFCDSICSMTALKLFCGGRDLLN